MKPQDILFIIILAALLLVRKPRWLVWAGLACIFISIPLFAKWIFFTAERLDMYALGFLLAAIIVFMFQKTKK